MKRLRSLNLLISLTLLVVLAALPAYGQNGGGLGLEIAIAAQERHTDILMANPGVVGVGVGRNRDGDPAVVILTETRGVGGLPRTLDGVPVVLRQSGRIYALPRCQTPPCGGGGGGQEDGGSNYSRTEKWPRPVPPGISTGHPAITAGTICCRVTNGTNVFAMSNNHVYADENGANHGDAVIQPGTYDGGTSPADDIGSLYDYVEIKFDGSNNLVDAAIALISTNQVGNSTPPDGYGTPLSTTAEAYPNQKVKKYGRTTGLTKGSVYVVKATVDVGYSTGVARFVNQIVIQPGGFSAGGDSGSLIVVDGKGKDKNDNNKPVGLLYAGSAFFTIANPIDDVLSAFGVTIDGE